MAIAAVRTTGRLTLPDPVDGERVPAAGEACCPGSVRPAPTPREMGCRLMRIQASQQLSRWPPVYRSTLPVKRSQIAPGVTVPVGYGPAHGSTRQALSPPLRGLPRDCGAWSRRALPTSTCNVPSLSRQPRERQKRSPSTQHAPDSFDTIKPPAWSRAASCDWPERHRAARLQRRRARDNRVITGARWTGPWNMHLGRAAVVELRLPPSSTVAPSRCQSPFPWLMTGRDCRGTGVTRRIAGQRTCSVPSPTAIQRQPAGDRVPRQAQPRPDSTPMAAGMVSFTSWPSTTAPSPATPARRDSRVIARLDG